MRVGEWLAALAGEPQTAWEHLFELTGTVGPGVARQTGARLDFVLEEARQECLANLMQDVSSLRRAKPASALESFLWGYLRNVVFRLRSGIRCSAISPEVARASATREDADAPDHSREADLTDRQREAVQLLRCGMSVAGIARELGISWSAARDRLRGAHGRLSDEARRSFARTDSHWMREAFRKQLQSRHFENADILLLHAQGVSHADLGERVSLTREAVRCRLRRMRHVFSRESKPR